MTKTPILDFVDGYEKKNAVRLHMPGHKGRGGAAERHDITEIAGADSLFLADGIIKESEKNAGEIFGAYTLYSTEGSSLSIRAMLYLVTVYAKRLGKRPLIAAARNAHKSFVSAAALIDFEVEWICPEDNSYLSARFSAEEIKEYFNSTAELPVALYLTSPDYLGFISDIKKIAEECHKRGVLLIVDNAHGAYLKFLSPSRHPIDLGADMCCDSAHKTLSALTGCGYMHISKAAPKFFKEKAKSAMMLFASTSPSYLLLRSLDGLNGRLCAKYKQLLENTIGKLSALRADLISHGYTLVGDEPMKLTIKAKDYGYLGTELSDYLLSKNIFAEHSDPDYTVLMPSTENTDEDMRALYDALLSLPRRKKITELPPSVKIPKRALSIREAVMSDSELLPISLSEGRIAASVTVGCPPAVPIAVSGEVIDKSIIEVFRYYGIDYLSVVK